MTPKTGNYPLITLEGAGQFDRSKPEYTMTLAERNAVVFFWEALPPGALFPKNEDLGAYQLKNGEAWEIIAIFEFDDKSQIFIGRAAQDGDVLISIFNPKWSGKGKSFKLAGYDQVSLFEYFATIRQDENKRDHAEWLHSVAVRNAPPVPNVVRFKVDQDAHPRV